MLETIDLDRVHFKGYAFQVEMKFTAYKCGFKLVEVPIIFINRALGVSQDELFDLRGGFIRRPSIEMVEFLQEVCERKHAEPCPMKTEFDNL